MNNRKVKKDPFEKYLITGDQESDDPYAKYAIKDGMESYDPQALRTSNTLPADKLRQIAMMPPDQQKEAQNQLIEGSQEQGKGFIGGAKEKFLQQLAALKGQEREPKETQNSTYPEWMKSGEMLGHFVGGLPLVLAGSAAGGAVGGLPGAIAGGAAMGFGTTSGDVPSRVVGGIEGGATSTGNALLKTPQFLKALLTKSNPDKVVKSVQQGHDVLSEGSKKIYQNVDKEVSARNVNVIPVQQNFIEDLATYLPKTRANTKLINDAKSGEYSALRALQSDLGDAGTRAKLSKSIAENNMGEEMLDKRRQLNEMIQNHLTNTGNHDLVESLQEANKMFSKMHDVYYDNKVIGKMVNKRTRKIPKNPMNVFGERSVQMDKLIKEHPEIMEEIDLLKAKDKISKALIGGRNAGLGLGAIFGAKKGYDLLNQD